MANFVQTIKNIWKIEELRKRILYTIALIAVYRLGCYIVIPGIDASQLANLQQQSSEGLLGLMNMFSGGAFGNASVFALGVMPYISASIVIQLLGVMFPFFQRLQREGESGHRKMNQYTRYLTILIIAIQGPAYIANLRAQLPASAFLVQMGSGWYAFIATLILLGGSMFVMWLGERITDRGIGNGISLIIMIGIIARLPQALYLELMEKFSKTTGGILMFIVELVVLFFVFVATIALVQAVRKVPVQYAKRVVGGKMYGGVKNNIPLKVNAAGVMPIIFAQAMMLIPLLFTRFNVTKGLAAVLNNSVGFWYNFIFALMVIIFTYFYTAVTINPTNMSEDLKKNGGFIPGYRAGRPTADFIRRVLNKITLFGAIYLGIVAVLPLIFSSVTKMTGIALGGTSIIIVVGVALEIVQALETQMLMRHYKGFLE